MTYLMVALCLGFIATLRYIGGAAQRGPTWVSRLEMWYEWRSYQRRQQRKLIR